MTTNWLQFGYLTTAATKNKKQKQNKKKGPREKQQNQLETKKCLEEDRLNRWEFLCLYWRKITQEKIKKYVSNNELQKVKQKQQKLL